MSPDHDAQLKEILREHDEATAETKRLHESWRSQAKEFIEGKLSPALEAAGATFEQSGRGFEVETNYGPVEADESFGELVIKRNGRHEFTYRVVVNTSVYGVKVTTWSTSAIADSEASEISLEESEVHGGDGARYVSALNARAIVQDIFAHYKNRLRGLRASA